MILNIVDRRKNNYRWRNVYAVIEPTVHDNSVKNSDKTNAEESYYAGIGFDEQTNISVKDAIKWANDQLTYVTLYLYDLDEDQWITKKL